MSKLPEWVEKEAFKGCNKWEMALTKVAFIEGALFGARLILDRVEKTRFRDHPIPDHWTDEERNEAACANEGRESIRKEILGGNGG